MPEAQAMKCRPDNANIYTLGGRVNGLLDEHWKYWAEGAYQFGRKEYPILSSPYIPAGTYRDLNAFGVNSKLTYMFKDRLNNQLACSFEFLSGDNPNSATTRCSTCCGAGGRAGARSGFTVMRRRRESGQEANLIRFGPTWSINPIKDMEFSASYYALLAASGANPWRHSEFTRR